MAGKKFATLDTLDPRLKVIPKGSDIRNRDLEEVRELCRLAYVCFRLLLSRRRARRADDQSETFRARALKGFDRLGVDGIVWRGKGNRRFHAKINLRGTNLVLLSSGVLRYFGKETPRLQVRIAVPIDTPLDEAQQEELERALESVLGRDAVDNAYVLYSSAELDELRRLHPEMDKIERFQTYRSGTGRELEVDFDKDED